jgi:hypothetical protein
MAASSTRSVFKSYARGDAAALALAFVAGCASAPAGRAAAPSAAAPTPERAACDRGDAEACAGEARRLAAPAAAGPDDLAVAFRLADRACALGSDDGCTGLSALYAQGRGVAKDDAKAVAIVRASCDRGGPGGCAVLGSYLLEGMHVRRDEAAAHALCLEGPRRARGLWCALLGMDIDQERAPGGPDLILKAYQHACTPEVDLGCTRLAAALFRFGRRAEGLALGDRLCAGGDKAACADMNDLRAMMAREQRDGGGPAGTPPGPIHLRAPDEGVSYDPPGNNWGTGVPTHEAGPRTTVWRWWRPGTQVEVAALRALPPNARPRTADMIALALEGIARGSATAIAHGKRVDSGPDTLAGRACSHAWFDAGDAGRGDVFITLVGDTLYSLLVLQNVAFDAHLLERAKAGLRIDAKADMRKNGAHD